jgi:hypothetical protein
MEGKRKVERWMAGPMTSGILVTGLGEEMEDLRVSHSYL